MRTVKCLKTSILNAFRATEQMKALEMDVDILLRESLSELNRKIVVLDDDPTGVQTVHGVSVYTDWTEESIQKGFEEEGDIFYILTNSRSFTQDQTIKAHEEIAKNIITVSSFTGKDFIIISRGDSTMRGHYPIETQILHDEIEKNTSKKIDGEIICPFFKEGGRYTIGNIHYVVEGDLLVPAGLTEFSKDKSFGYKSSHLGDWCEEKTNGIYKAEDITYISVENLRNQEIETITAQLCSVKDFNKVVVNAIDYLDIKIFMIAFAKAVLVGKEFIFRSAAPAAKVLGQIKDRPFLGKKELISKGNTNGGIIIIGSHVNKTTRQVEELKNCKYPIEFIEFNQHLVVEEGRLESEVGRVVEIVECAIKKGQTVVVYTRRDRFDLATDDKDQQLSVSVKISDAVTSIVGKLTVRPNFIIAKGGITSSDIGTKALNVKRALVMGQVKPGIPVWRTGKESKFPNLPYIIFPGNVGEVDTLREVVEILMG